jgi:hypothetical protein
LEDFYKQQLQKELQDSKLKDKEYLIKTTESKIERVIQYRDAIGEELDRLYEEHKKQKKAVV